MKLRNITIEISEYSNPYLFGEEEYYFGYKIYNGSQLIACGQDSIEASDNITIRSLFNEIKRNLEYYLFKPNIHECGKIMQDCYNTCIESESGMCFLEPEFMDDYTNDDIEIFLKDIKKFNLNELCIIENYNSVEDAKKSGEDFAICYGALGNYFNNI